MARYVIVGGGIAAASAVTEIRKYDSRGDIAIISGEKSSFYYRSLIPLLVTGEKQPADLLPPAPPGDRIELLPDRAVSLDVQRKVVQTTAHGAIGYEKLLLAMGSTPIIPDIARVDPSQLFFLRTMDDALRLRDAAQPGRRAVVVGGGIIGVKAAKALVARGLAVTIVEKQKHLLWPRLDEEGAGLISTRLQGHGIEVVTNDTVAEVLPGHKRVKLASGTVLDAELLVVAIGVCPATDLVEACRGATGGIPVNAKMETALDSVYAAGDIVQLIDSVSGQAVASTLWPAAVRMGKVAGANMAGGKLKYDSGLAVLNALQVEDVPIISAGDLQAVGEGCETIRWRRSKAYRKFVLRDDKLIGALFMGEIDRAGVYISLIKTATPLGPLKERLREGTLHSGLF